MQETYLNGGNPSLEELHAEDVVHDDVKDGAVDDNMEDAKKVADFLCKLFLDTLILRACKRVDCSAHYHPEYTHAPS